MGGVAWAKGLSRFDIKALGIAVLIAIVIVIGWATVARLIDGAVAEWRAAQERERANLIERVAKGAAEARARYENHLGEAVQRATELEQELAKYTDGDPVVFPRGLARKLNQ